MDAFLKQLLFAADVALLTPQRDEDATHALKKLLETHGAEVVAEQDAEQRGVGVVLVLGDPSQKMLLGLRQRFPRADILKSTWVQDSVKKNRRLATESYQLVKLQAAQAQDETSGTKTADTPPAKRQKTAEFFTSATIKTDEELPQPQLRPWKIEHKSLYVLDAREQHGAEQDKVKIAGFDLDGTLIVTKSGKRFAKDKDDWKWFHPTLVKDKLKQLKNDGFTLVIFSNQNGIAKGNVSAEEVQTKLEAIIRALKLPMMVFLGTESDMMRKPRVGAWQEMAKLLGEKGEEAIDKEKSFYCGDAAGRPKIAGRPKDFAATDYKFALNLGIRFFTPEELFLGSKQRIHTRPDTWELGFNPKSIVIDDMDDRSAPHASSDQEMVVLVGPPASGKSFFARTRLSSYVIISQDELRTAANCKKKCLEALAQKKSVAVDITNRDPRTRKEWLTIAQQHKIPIRCFEMDIEKPLSMHLNTFRSLTEQKKIPEVAIHGFYKNFVPPTVKEGFAEVEKIPFRIDSSVDKASQAMLQSYL